MAVALWCCKSVSGTFWQRARGVLPQTEFKYKWQKRIFAWRCICRHDVWYTGKKYFYKHSTFQFLFFSLVLCRNIDFILSQIDVLPRAHHQHSGCDRPASQTQIPELCCGHVFLRLLLLIFTLSPVPACSLQQQWQSSVKSPSSRSFPRLSVQTSEYVGKCVISKFCNNAEWRLSGNTGAVQGLNVHCGTCFRIIEDITSNWATR